MKADASRRRKPQEKPDPELEALIKADAGKGVSTKLSDRAWWLEPYIDDPELRPWFDALADADRGDPAALRRLQRTERPPEAVQRHIDHLLKWRLTRRPGRPFTPSYDLTASEARMAWALREMKAAIKSGMSIKKAAVQYARGGITVNALERAYNNQLGSMRRVRQRLFPKK